VDETRAIFAPLKQRTEDAVTKLEEQIALAESAGNAKDDHLSKAKEALKQGKDALKKDDE
jgi:tubulin-specific chaperone A